jgi:HAD superfamily hydrolase (TIGR01509 family)
MLNALIFDFDGTILDTEGPVFHGWAKTFTDMGCSLSFEEYSVCIANDHKREILRALLEERTRHSGKTIDWESLDLARRTFYRPLVEKLPILSGVTEILHAARAAGIKIAVCSSSPRHWVAGHLDRLNLAHWFDALICREDAINAKPHPDLYLEALKRLNVPAHHAVAFEDAPNGAIAARAAGIYCIAVPNEWTARLRFDEVDRRVTSLTEVSWDCLCEWVANRQR